MNRTTRYLPLVQTILVVLLAVICFAAGYQSGWRDGWNEAIVEPEQQDTGWGRFPKGVDLPIVEDGE